MCPSDKTSIVEPEITGLFMSRTANLFDVLHPIQSVGVLALCMNVHSHHRLSLTCRDVRRSIARVPCTPDSAELHTLLVRSRSFRSTDDLTCLRHVQHVDFSGYMAYDIDIVTLCVHAESIKSLRFNRNFVHGGNRCLMAIAEHAGMQHLELGWCILVHSHELAQLIRKLPQLAHFGLCGGYQLTNHVLEAFASPNLKLRVLRVLALRHCDKLTDHAVAIVAQHCKQLVELDLSGCSGLREVTRWPPLLQNVTLSRCRGIHDWSVLSLISCCKETLAELNLEFCERLTDIIALPLAKQCARLQRLNVFQCTNMSARGIRRLEDSSIYMITCVGRT